MNPATHVLLGSIESTELSRQEFDFLSAHDFAGITLFKRNICHGATSSCLSLIQSVQETRHHSQPPMIIAVDQEGGRVSRFGTGCPDLGPPLELKKGQVDKNSLMTIENYAHNLGNYLKDMGINVNFAPVVDILTRKANEAIGNRAFGLSSTEVSLRAGSFLKGLQNSKIKGCLKHFPGQGDAPFDTHLRATNIEVNEKQLHDRELIPFRKLLDEVQMVMVSHCIYPQICPLEASRSPTIMTSLLREKMGFSGIIVSDDMTMGAVCQSTYDLSEYIIESIMAGCDLVLICQGLESWINVYENITRRSKNSSALMSRLYSAAENVLSFRKNLYHNSLSHEN